MYARLMGYTNEQLFNLSQKIINNSPNCFFGEAYNISFTDVYDFCSKKQSLKKWEIELSNMANNPHSKMDDEVRALCKKIKHHELGLPWDQPVPEELWTKVAEYCDDDVIATEATYKANLGDFVADVNTVTPEGNVESVMLRDHIDALLGDLKERERQVIELRFGLRDGHPRTLEEVGKEFNVTRERIRQIEAKALRKLRHPNRSRKLKDFLYN